MVNKNGIPLCGKSRETLKWLWNSIFRPSCYGNDIHCPYLFTDKMYACKYYEECNKETLKNFIKLIKTGDL